MDQRGPWSAAGGVVMAVGAAASIGWLTLAVPSPSNEEMWPVWVFAGIAFIGLYGMLAPLLHWWPWREQPPIATATAHMDDACWLNDRRELGNAMLAGWSQMRNMPDLCADAVRWEQETHDGLAEHVPSHRAHFRDENGLGPEWQRQRSGPHEYEDAQRVMLRRRLHRLAEIAERMQP